MNAVCKAGALILVAAFAAGCRHKTQATPPAAAQAPTFPISTLAKSTPPPQMPPPELPKVNPPGSENTAPPPKPKRKKLHRKPKAVEPGTEQAPAQTPAKDQTASTEQTANSGGSDVSPIGQLSAAGESVNAPRHREILDEINTAEKGLNDIKRALSTDEQTTATQIRAFLTKAKDALNQEDLDGAQTLATKAKVLLAELTKQ